MLLDFLLDPSDLHSKNEKKVSKLGVGGFSLVYTKTSDRPTCLVIKIDVKLNLTKVGFFF